MKTKVCPKLNKRYKPASELQKAARAKNWAVYYMLHQPNLVDMSDLSMSQGTTLQCIHLNNYIRRLRDSLERDYLVYKEKVLAARKLEKEALANTKILLDESQK